MSRPPASPPRVVLAVTWHGGGLCSHAEMAMPLHGCNRLNAATACADHCVDNPAKGFNCSVCSNTAGGGPSSHQWFEQFETQGWMFRIS